MQLLECTGSTKLHRTTLCLQPHLAHPRRDALRRQPAHLPLASHCFRSLGPADAVQRSMQRVHIRLCIAAGVCQVQQAGQEGGGQAFERDVRRNLVGGTKGLAATASRQPCTLTVQALGSRPTAAGDMAKLWPTKGDGSGNGHESATTPSPASALAAPLRSSSSGGPCSPWIAPAARLASRFWAPPQPAQPVQVSTIRCRTL